MTPERIQSVNPHLGMPSHWHTKAQGTPPAQENEKIVGDFAQQKYKIHQTKYKIDETATALMTQINIEPTQNLDRQEYRNRSTNSQIKVITSPI